MTRPVCPRGWSRRVPVARARELCKAPISQSHGEGPDDLTLARTLLPLKPGPFATAVALSPDPQGEWKSSFGNLRVKRCGWLS